MKLPDKAGGKPQFSDTEEEIYFLKQLGSHTKSRGGTEGHGIGIYLCKMKPDGSEKTEIKELWHNPNYPIDAQGQTTWMDVNAKTHKIALSVTYAGSDVTGLWTMNLDGTDLNHLITPSMVNGHLRAVDSPSWTPDGQWIVFCEFSRSGTNTARIAKCDSLGKNETYLSDGPADGLPRVSPDGTKILYRHDPMKKLGSDAWGDHWVAATLWLMDLDGTDKREILNPEAKPSWPTKGASGRDATWSPDGKSIYLTGMTCLIIDSRTGKTVVAGQPTCMGKPYTPGWAHWGRLGFVGYTVGGLLRTDPELKEATPLGTSRRVECSQLDVERCRW